MLRESAFIRLEAVVPFANSSTRQAATTLEGAMFTITSPIEFNRILWRVTALAGVPTIRLLVYQGIRGTLDEPFHLIAQVTAGAVVAGDNSSALDGGEYGRAAPGRLFVLFGRSSAAGNVTLRTFQGVSVDGLTQNIPAGLIPAVFATALPATGTPAATITPSGFTPSNGNLAPFITLRRV